MSQKVTPPKAKLTEEQKKENRSKAAKKAAATRAANKAAKDALKNDSNETTPKGKVEFWVRQIRLKGRTITGEVKPEDKKEFLETTKANGVQIDERDWFKKEDWRARVYKNYDVVREKELMEAKLANL